MFVFQFCPKLQDKHCKIIMTVTMTMNMTGKIRYMPPPLDHVTPKPKENSVTTCRRPQSCLTVRNGKKSPGQETGLENRGRLKLLNLEGHSCSFRSNLVSFRSFRRPLISKPVSCTRLFYRFLHQHYSSPTGCKTIFEIQNKFSGQLPTLTK